MPCRLSPSDSATPPSKAETLQAETDPRKSETALHSASETSPRVADTVVPSDDLLLCCETLSIPTPRYLGGTLRVFIDTENVQPGCPEESVVQRVLHIPAWVRKSHLQNGDYVSAAVRERVVDWILDIGGQFKVRGTTVAVAVSCFDRALYNMSVYEKDLQTLAAVCLIIACKIEEAVTPRVAEVMDFCSVSWSKQSVIEMEARVLAALDFRVGGPTHFTIAQHLLLDAFPSHPYFTYARRRESMRLAEFVSYIALYDAQVCRYGPGIVAVGCAIVVCELLGLDDGEIEGPVELSVWDRIFEKAREVSKLIMQEWLSLSTLHFHKDHLITLLCKFPKEADTLARYAPVKEKVQCGGQEQEHSRLQRVQR